MRRRRLIIICLVVITLAVVGGRLTLWVTTRSTAAAQDLAPGPHRVGIVFGAGLEIDGTPSPLLTDRLMAGEELLRAGIVDRLLMSGDNSVAGHNEPGAMRRASIERGVSADQIAVDYGGRRTWDSCARARTIFGVTHAVVITNDFHRDRTVAICRAAGISVDGAVGTSTDKYSRADRTNWRVRELAASWRGVVDAWIHHPDVAVGGAAIDIYDPVAVRNSLSPTDRTIP